MRVSTGSKNIWLQKAGRFFRSSFRRPLCRLWKTLPGLTVFFTFLSCPISVLPARAGEADVQVVPPRIIKPKTPAETSWYSLWMEARTLTREKHYPEAVAKYNLLLAQKGNLEPAQWELVQVLLKLEKYPEAAAILEVLLELDPDKLDYLEALADIMMAQGHEGRAAELFRRAYELSAGNTALLEKLGRVLLEAGDAREALPYLEELFQRRPGDRTLRRNIAGRYHALGQDEKARDLLLPLANSDDADLETLLLAARIHDRLGQQSVAAGYWKRVLARQPDNREGRGRLLAYYEQEGQGPEVLEYLLALLREQPDKPETLRRVGQIYAGMKKFAEALPYLERYLALRPKDREVLRQMVDIHAGLGNQQQSLDMLDQLTPLEQEADIESLRRDAMLYEGGGRFEEAARRYEKILKITPDDTEILVRRARALLAAGKERAVSELWQELTRRQKLLEVLEELHRLEPADQRVTQRLAALYADLGRLDEGRVMYEELTAAGNRAPAVLMALAALYEKMNWPEHAFAAYDGVLKVYPPRAEVVFPLLRLAGQLGLADRVEKLWTELPAAAPEKAEWEGRAQFAAALAAAYAGEEARAVYQGLLADREAPEAARLAALKGIAETYWRENLPHEAEQVLREALAATGEEHGVLRRLFEFSLAQGRNEEAAIWLDRLRGLAGASPDTPAARMLQTEIVLLRGRLLLAEGENRLALKLVPRLLEELEADDSPLPPVAAEERLRFEARLAQVQYLLAAGKLEEAEEHGLSLAAHYPGNLEVPVLLNRVYLAADEADLARREIDKAFAMTAGDLGLLLQLADLYREQGDFPEMIAAAEKAVEKNPASLKARFLLAEGFELRKENQEAIRVLAAIKGDYPQHPGAAVKLTKLLMKSGRFAEALVLSEQLLARWRRADLLQVKARILWEQKKWEEALAIYQEFLTPAAEQLFVENCRALSIEPPPPEKRSIWEIISSGKTDEKIFLDRVMRPEFAVSPAREDQLYTAAAAPLYSRYSWQEHFQLELRARKAVIRREYFAAVKYFEELVKKFPDDASLQFDLAGVYSRLGSLGKEGVLYDRIAEINAAYPGLDEASQRNRLKLRPRTALDYGYRREEGREGYKALRSEWQGGSFWFSPRPQQELDFSLTRLDYRATDIERKVKANRAELFYNTSLTERVGVTLGGGVEALGNGHPDATLAEAGLKASLGNRITASLSFDRDLLHDTTASLTRNIMRDAVNAGAAIDLLPGLSAGGQYVLMDYSDNNLTKGYDLWTSYIILSDPVHLEFKYKYDFKESQEWTIPDGPLQEDGFTASDHPYWAPVNYWQNRFSLFFKHQLSDELYARGIPSYYSAEYSVSYDSRGYAIQTWQGGILAEFTSHLLVEAGAGVTTSQEYRDRAISLSVVYRW